MKPKKNPTPPKLSQTTMRVKSESNFICKNSSLLLPNTWSKPIHSTILISLLWQPIGVVMSIRITSFGKVRHDCLNQESVQNYAIRKTFTKRFQFPSAMIQSFGGNLATTSRWPNRDKVAVPEQMIRLGAKWPSCTHMVLTKQPQGTKQRIGARYALMNSFQIFSQQNNMVWKKHPTTTTFMKLADSEYWGYFFSNI